MSTPNDAVSTITAVAGDLKTELLGVSAVVLSAAGTLLAVKKGYKWARSFIG